MDHVKIHKLIRSRRRTIALVVGPDATLTVRAPFETPTEFIHDLVNRKRTWITKKILEVRARPRPRNKKFVNGESFLYLGNYYRLRVGNLRVLFLLAGDAIQVYAVKDRKDAYE